LTFLNSLNLSLVKSNLRRRVGDATPHYRGSSCECSSTADTSFNAVSRSNVGARHAAATFHLISA
jgi:hypothetical protein